MHRDLARCRAGIYDAVKGIPVRAADAKPAKGWSIANVLEHLDLSFVRNADGLERRLQRGTPPPPMEVSGYYKIGKFLITKVGYFPKGRKAPDVVVPTGRSFAELLVVIDPHLMRLDQRLTEAARAFGTRRPVVNHPILGPMTVPEWRRFHWVHTRHHLRQVKRSGLFSAETETGVSVRPKKSPDLFFPESRARA